MFLLNFILTIVGNVFTKLIWHFIERKLNQDKHVSGREQSLKLGFNSKITRVDMLQKIITQVKKKYCIESTLIHNRVDTPSYSKCSLDRCSNFNIKKIKTLDELQSAIKELPNTMLFRGISNAYYKIYSSYHRELFNSYYIFQRETTLHSDLIDRFLMKISIFEKFSQNYRQYIRNQGSGLHVNFTKLQLDYYIQLMSYSQHYITLSHFVDFTENPYVALHFAVKSIDAQKEPFALFYIDPVDIGIHPAFLPSNDKIEFDQTSLLDDIMKSKSVANTYKKFHSGIHSKDVYLFRNSDFIVPNDRLLKQKGALVSYSPYDVTNGLDKMPFENFFKNPAYNPENPNGNKIGMLEIDASLVKDVKELLDNKGINEVSLGLDLGLI